MLTGPYFRKRNGALLTWDVISAVELASLILIVTALALVVSFLPVRHMPSSSRRRKIGSHRDEWNPEAIRLRPTVGGFVFAVGESIYLDELKEILRGTPKRKGKYETIATLSPEPLNPHDANAIRVLIRTKPVGYLSRADAKTFRKSHSAAIASAKIIQCKARLTGGTRGKPNIGVLLDFDINEEVRYKRPLT
jgi:hypothetical protein